MSTYINAHTVLAPNQLGSPCARARGAPRTPPKINSKEPQPTPLAGYYEQEHRPTNYGSRGSGPTSLTHVQKNVLCLKPVKNILLCLAQHNRSIHSKTLPLGKSTFRW